MNLPFSEADGPGYFGSGLRPVQRGRYFGLAKLMFREHVISEFKGK